LSDETTVPVEGAVVVARAGGVVAGATGAGVDVLGPVMLTAALGRVVAELLGTEVRAEDRVAGVVDGVAGVVEETVECVADVVPVSAVEVVVDEL